MSRWTYNSPENNIDRLARKLAAAEAKVRELEAARYEQEQRGNNYCEAAMAAEQKLADANALLERARLDVRNPVASTSTIQLIRDINTHLAGQPTAHGKFERKMAKLGLHHMGESAADVKARSMQAQSTSEFDLAMAEKAVLDACKAANAYSLRMTVSSDGQNCFTPLGEKPWFLSVADAELARRGLK